MEYNTDLLYSENCLITEGMNLQDDYATILTDYQYKQKPRPSTQHRITARPSSFLTELTKKTHSMKSRLDDKKINSPPCSTTSTTRKPQTLFDLKYKNQDISLEVYKIPIVEERRQIRLNYQLRERLNTSDPRNLAKSYTSSVQGLQFQNTSDWQKMLITQLNHTSFFDSVKQKEQNQHQIYYFGPNAQQSPQTVQQQIISRRILSSRFKNQQEKRQAQYSIPKLSPQVYTGVTSPIQLTVIKNHPQSPIRLKKNLKSALIVSSVLSGRVSPNPESKVNNFTLTQHYLEKFKVSLTSVNKSDQLVKTPAKFVNLKQQRVQF